MAMAGFLPFSAIYIELYYIFTGTWGHRVYTMAFLCGGSTGLFIYAYCFYYYKARSDMLGLVQASFFCYGFFLMLATVGFRTSLLFVRHIYRPIKCE
ncbi:hypothetical protein HPP92_005612 [Vanilla planifolia]|uniref:Transmembrane 9 superfamily member n=1 Tax=Vanilla planifolia TaxID=51239 RepID=A0A835VEV6_VANPL|nr:hypothetical protein HPP92_005612 [Vanilla planifolia]